MFTLCMYMCACTFVRDGLHFLLVFINLNQLSLSVATNLSVKKTALKRTPIRPTEASLVFSFVFYYIRFYASNTGILVIPCTVRV